MKKCLFSLMLATAILQASDETSFDCNQTYYDPECMCLQTYCVLVTTCTDPDPIGPNYCQLYPHLCNNDEDPSVLPCRALIQVKQFIMTPGSNNDQSAGFIDGPTRGVWGNAFGLTVGLPPGSFARDTDFDITASKSPHSSIILKATANQRKDWTTLKSYQLSGRLLVTITGSTFCGDYFNNLAPKSFSIPMLKTAEVSSEVVSDYTQGYEKWHHIIGYACTLNPKEEKVEIELTTEVNANLLGSFESALGAVVSAEIGTSSTTKTRATKTINTSKHERIDVYTRKRFREVVVWVRHYDFTGSYFAREIQGGFRTVRSEEIVDAASPCY